MCKNARSEAVEGASLRKKDCVAEEIPKVETDNDVIEVVSVLFLTLMCFQLVFLASDFSLTVHRVHVCSSVVRSDLFLTMKKIFAAKVAYKSHRKKGGVLRQQGKSPLMRGSGRSASERVSD